MHANLLKVLFLLHNFGEWSCLSSAGIFERPSKIGPLSRRIVLLPSGRDAEIRIDASQPPRMFSGV